MPSDAAKPVVRPPIGSLVVCAVLFGLSALAGVLTLASAADRSDALGDPARASRTPASQPVTRPFATGVDANYAPAMERDGRTWAAADGTPGDPYRVLAAAGADAFRLRLWVGDDGPHGLTAATATAKRATAAGLKPYAVLFLSDDWADLVKQPAAAAWKGFDERAKLAAVEAYAERVARHLAAAGLDVDLYEIGNEIDFGVCGVFEEEWPKRVSLDYMSQRVWPAMAAILRAAETGVRKARPDARFVLHLARWDEPDYAVAFWRFMAAAGVAVDVPGLSYFPTSAADPARRPVAFFREQVAKIHAALGKPVLVCETAYPCRPAFGGQFADWNKPVPGYPLDEAGQRVWVADFLSAVRGDGHFAGAFYWSPEWHGPGMWEAFALFDGKGVGRPALGSLAAGREPKATAPR